MQHEQVARLRGWQLPRLQKFLVVPRKDIAAFAERPCDHHPLHRPRSGPTGRHHGDVVVRPVHRRPDQVVEARVHHHEPMARALVVCTGVLDVRHPPHQDSGPCYRVTPRLYLQRNLPPCRLAQRRRRLEHKRSKPRHVVALRVEPVGVGNAPAKIHGPGLRELLQQRVEDADQPPHVLVELADLWPRANVGMQGHNRVACLLRSFVGSTDLLMPDAVLARRPPGIAGLHMPVPEPRIHP